MILKRQAVLVVLLIIIQTESHAQAWLKSDRLWESSIRMGMLDSAVFYANESAAIIRGTSGENNLQYAGCLRKLASAYFYIGSYKKAEYYILKEVALLETIKASEDARYVDALVSAALICRKAGDYEDALTQVKKAEKKAASVYGAQSREFAGVLESCAGVYHDYGSAENDMVYMKQTESYLKRAESIYLGLMDSAREHLAFNRMNQAAYYNNVGNFPVAEALMYDAISFFRSQYGSASPVYASAINNLAVLYYNGGNYRLAEKNLIEAVSVFKSGPLSSGVKTAVCLNNLGALYHDLGNFSVAEKLLDEAISLMKMNSQSDSPDYAVTINNLASVFLSGDYYATSENKNRKRFIESGLMLREADSVFNLNCHMPHPYNQSLKGNLAIWYNLTGDKFKSVKILNDLAYEGSLSLRVVSMMSKMSYSETLPGIVRSWNYAGPEPVIIPVSINLIDQVAISNAEMNSIENDALTTALMRMFIGRATNIRKAVGSYHPAYSNMLKSLIVTYGSYDDVKREEELTLEYMNVINQRTLRDFSFLSESEKEFYYQTRLPDMHSFISYSLSRKRTNPAITCQAYNNILLNKGLMLKSSTAMRLAILNSNNPELLKEYDTWISLQKEISALYATPVEMRTKDLGSLEERAKELERSLVSKSQDFSDYRKGLQITWEDVRNSLKPDEAAIEFTDFRKRERDGGDEVIYCALIVRNDSKYPEMVKLFTEDQLRALIERPAYTPYVIGLIYGTESNPDDKLYNLIWKPLEQYLEGAATVYVSPSGLLNKVSFAALSKGKGIYLCDNYKINIKVSTGASSAAGTLAGDKRLYAMIFGGINYSSGRNADEVWSYLEGTKKEGDIIAGILEGASFDVRYLAENHATEAYFKENASRYNFLHLATHGFFFEDPNRKRFEQAQRNIEFGTLSFRGKTRSLGVNNFVNNENPLMRSGLVLAGANDVWTDTVNVHPEDGVLTAQEVTQIDMRKGSLVVLSACETGLGDIKGSEGVYGLQRALKIAGARFIIMSLWEIPDRETVEFMTVFYNSIVKTGDIRSSFHAARESLRAKYDPYYWAAFVLMD
jgi:CHAT domain-containing protein